MASVQRAPAESPSAARTAAAQGEDGNPSAWERRLPLGGLALIGARVAGYLTLFQLGLFRPVWEPFFGGSRAILTGRIAHTLPIPDASLGALAYLVELLLALIGGPDRWRRRPWLALLFGAASIPFGVVSLTLLVLQPTLNNGWCTLCLVSVAVSVAIIPFAHQEFAAAWQRVGDRRADGLSWRDAIAGR